MALNHLALGPLMLVISFPNGQEVSLEEPTKVFLVGPVV